MKEAYAVRRTVPPSAEIEEQIDRLLAVGVGENPRESLSELAKLGARLIIQRAVEEEFDAWLGRARYERRPGYQRGLRNGFRPRGHRLHRRGRRARRRACRADGDFTFPTICRRSTPCPPRRARRFVAATCRRPAP